MSAQPLRDPTEVARLIAHRRCDELYGSMWRAVYLTELQGRMDLSDAALILLHESQAELSDAIGLQDRGTL